MARGEGGEDHRPMVRPAGRVLGTPTPAQRRQPMAPGQGLPAWGGRVPGSSGRSPQPQGAPLLSPDSERVHPSSGFRAMKAPGGRSTQPIGRRQRGCRAAGSGPHSPHTASRRTLPQEDTGCQAVLNEGGHHRSPQQAPPPCAGGPPGGRTPWRGKGTRGPWCTCR